MALRNNPRFEIIKPLPNIGSQIRCSYFLVKDSQEPKIQKMLCWSDFGPFKSLEDKNLQSVAKSLGTIEVYLRFASFQIPIKYSSFLASIHWKATPDIGDRKWNSNNYQKLQGRVFLGCYKLNQASPKLLKEVFLLLQVQSPSVEWYS